MSIVQMQTLGQALEPDMQLPYIPSPRVPAQTVAEYYQMLLDWCDENLGPELCRSFLPQHPIYLPPPSTIKDRIPWWGWIIVGLLAGKVLRI